MNRSQLRPIAGITVGAHSFLRGERPSDRLIEDLAYST